MVVVQVLEYQHLGGRVRMIFEFEVNPVYRISSKRARDTQRYSVSKNYKQTNKQILHTWQKSSSIEWIRLKIVCQV